MQRKTVLSVVTFAPRLVQLGSVAALGLALQGCVSARHYEEARTVAETETAAHGRTRARLEGAVKRIHDLEADLAKKEKDLSERESEAAQSKLDSTVALKEREAATQLVEQLRSELARTGDHLSSYSREKRDLQQTLLIAEQRMQGIETAGRNLGELVAATRDLALALAAPLGSDTVALGAKDGQVVVSAPADKLFTADSDSLLLDAAPLLTAIGKVAAAHPALRVTVREPTQTLAVERARRLGEALRERGVPESRLTLPQLAIPAAPVVADAEAAQGEVADAGEKAEKREATQKPAPSAAPAPRYEIAFGF